MEPEYGCVTVAVLVLTAAPARIWSLLDEPCQPRQPETDAREVDAQQKPKHLESDEGIHGAEHVGHGHPRRGGPFHVEQRRSERWRHERGLQIDRYQRAEPRHQGGVVA